MLGPQCAGLEDDLVAASESLARPDLLLPLFSSTEQSAGFPIPHLRDDPLAMPIPDLPGPPHSMCSPSDHPAVGREHHSWGETSELLPPGMTHGMSHGMNHGISHGMAGWHANGERLVPGVSAIGHAHGLHMSPSWGRVAEHLLPNETLPPGTAAWHADVAAADVRRWEEEVRRRQMEEEAIGRFISRSAPSIITT
jgi:hypothetical protein